MAETSSAAPEPQPAEAASPWHGDRLAARSVRFTLTVMAPLVAGMLFGANFWIAYAVLTCILGCMLDTGGRALHRLGCFAVAGAVVLAGTGLGTLVRGDTALTTLALAFTGMLYALVESIHPSAAFAARFMCVTLAIGALYVPLALPDVAAVAAFVAYGWAVSMAWDVATGMWRPSTAPKLKDVVARVRATRRERWVFAAVVAATVSAAFLSSRALGLEHPSWALLALVIVLRADSQLSRSLIVSLMLGTLLGVAAALAYGAVLTSPRALLAGLAIAALVRWPAQQFHGVLGIASITAFVILLLQLVAVTLSEVSHAPFDRVVDITLGCGFAVMALWLNCKAQALLRRVAGS